VKAWAAPSASGPPRLFDSASDRRLASASWMAVLAASFVLIALSGFRSGDPDSRVYAGIAARLSAEPIARWIAPDWWGHWGFSGPFREHPIGIFLVPSLVARAGYPAPQAAYAVNGLFQAASIVLLQVVAVQVVSARDARALGWIVQLMPIAFVFRVRANQEYAVLAAILLGLLATERSLRKPAWAGLTALAFAWALLVKGVFGFVVPLVCAVWLAARTRVSRVETGLPPPLRFGETRRSLGEGPAQPTGSPSRPPVLAPWVSLALVLLVAPLLTISYEWAYVRATGDSFLAFYTGPRLRPDAVVGGAVGRVAYNVVWYTGRLIWYAFPWSLIAIAGFAAVARRYVARPDTPADRRRAENEHRAPAEEEHLAPAEDEHGGRAQGEHMGQGSSPAESGLLFALAASFTLIVLFSFSDRKADRFIFPAYYFIAAAGGVTAIRYSPRFARIADRLNRAWIPAAFWLALFLLRLATGSHLPQFTFWRS
jgi:hypothetical protein